MKSRTTAQFRTLLAALPAPIQRRAREAYKLFRDNPSHPSLRFKPIHTKAKGSFYSVRIGIHYRALALRERILLSGFGLALMRTMMHYFLNFSRSFSTHISAALLLLLKFMR